jgi:hypothetical protein
MARINRIKKWVLFIITFIFCICCNKRNVESNIQQSVESSASKVLRIDNIKDKVNPVLVLKEAKTLEEIIIESYDYIHLESYLRRFSFLVEGNFTTSGNKEIIGFYENLGNINPRLGAALCFVGDSSGENIENIYPIDWLGIDLINEEFETKRSLTEDLGRYIIWRDQKIGCIGDFNENGKEELYLYLSSGIGISLRIFEFDETGFVEILNIGLTTDEAYITGVNPVEKIIDIRIINKPNISNLTGKEGSPEIANNAITFNTGLKMGGSITLGNVIIHANGSVEDWNKSSPSPRYDNPSQEVNLGRHEEKHTKQYQKYGNWTIPLIIGSAVINGGIGEAIKNKTDPFGAFLGRSSYERAADDYAAQYNLDGSIR